MQSAVFPVDESHMSLNEHREWQINMMIFLNPQWYSKLASHRVELRLRRQVGVFVGVVVVGNIPREPVGMFDNTGNGSVNLPGHFIQKGCHLKEVSNCVPAYSSFS